MGIPEKYNFFKHFEKVVTKVKEVADEAGKTTFSFDEFQDVFDREADDIESKIRDYIISRLEDIGYKMEE